MANKFPTFQLRLPQDTDEVVGFNTPVATGSEGRYTFLSVFQYILGKLNLGTAANVNIGTELDEVPLNSEIGTSIQGYSAGLESIASLGAGANKMLYGTGINTYATTDLTSSARQLLDDASFTAMRATLSLTVGINVQAYYAGFDSIATLGTAADKMLYTTAADTYAEADLSAYGRSILDDADASEARQTLELSKGSDVASANDITLGAGNYFVITGTTDINTIDVTGIEDGRLITLEAGASFTLKHATAGTGAELSLEGSLDQAMTVDDTIMIQYNGTVWKQVAPKVVI